MRLRYLCVCLMMTLMGVADCASFYVIRHAEKGPGDDPGLTVEGQQRAQRIANLLSLTDIETVYSTNYQRTRQTAESIAQVKNLPVQQYDPKALKQFAEKLLLKNSSAVIVGHSNTTPQLARLLSGQSVPDMEEKSFNLIYQVITIPDADMPHGVVNVLSSD